jgi:hypothetical protein
MHTQFPSSYPNQQALHLEHPSTTWNTQSSIKGLPTFNQLLKTNPHKLRSHQNQSKIIQSKTSKNTQKHKKA